jgi:hypothetical protein
MAAAVLTASTISYLFASDWAPANTSSPLYVPGADVDGPTTAGNLLNVAVWRLHHQEVVEIEYVRPYEIEKVGLFRKPSFTRLRVIDEAVALPGLQGALLRVLKEAGDDAEGRGVRRLVLALDLNYRAPWSTVGGYCLGEARAAGVAELGGRRWHPIRRPVITDEGAYEALRPKHEEISAERAAYRRRNEELDNATLADCLHGVHWAHSDPD